MFISIFTVTDPQDTRVVCYILVKTHTNLKIFTFHQNLLNQDLYLLLHLVQYTTHSRRSVNICSNTEFMKKQKKRFSKIFNQASSIFSSSLYFHTYIIVYIQDCVTMTVNSERVSFLLIKTSGNFKLELVKTEI